MNIPTDYAKGAPAGYVCTTCGASGCKLWREYQTFANHSELVCCDCAGKSQERDVSRIDADGRIPISNGKYKDGTEAIQWCDQIGWRVPAVPTEEGDTYWGYTSVPQAGVDWWKRLPTRTLAKEPEPMSDTPTPAALVEEAFGQYEIAIDNAQRAFHNYQEWGEEQYGPIEAARAAFYKSTKALADALAARDAAPSGPEWGDEPLPEDAAIDAAHPTRTERHDLYAEAMRLVGARRSKGGLVELVNWLLARVEQAEAHADNQRHGIADLREIANARDAAHRAEVLTTRERGAVERMRERCAEVRSGAAADARAVLGAIDRLTAPPSPLHAADAEQRAAPTYASGERAMIGDIVYPAEFSDAWPGNLRQVVSIDPFRAENGPVHHSTPSALRLSRRAPTPRVPCRNQNPQTPEAREAIAEVVRVAGARLDAMAAAETRVVRAALAWDEQAPSKRTPADRWRALNPKERLNLVEWLDQHAREAAEANAGPYEPYYRSLSKALRIASAILRAEEVDHG